MPLELNFSLFTRLVYFLVIVENSSFEEERERKGNRRRRTKNECQKGKYVKFAENLNNFRGV